jgi:hypothetical protein
MREKEYVKKSSKSVDRNKNYWPNPLKKHPFCFRSYLLYAYHIYHVSDS